MEKIGPIRNTHYGGFYDFTPNMEKADTAYTNIALPAHTDTTYFTEPAGLQAFHMLSHQAPPGSGEADAQDGLGGQSLLVDGFQAAISLRQQNPEAFKTLCSVAIPWHASGNDGVAISPDHRYPVIETADGGLDSPVTRIRWNNADRGVVPHATREEAEKWYEAARLFDGLLRDSKSEYWFQLQPGSVLSKSMALRGLFACVFRANADRHLALQSSTTGVSSMGEVHLKVSAACAVLTVSLPTLVSGMELTICSKPGRLHFTVEDIEIRIGGLYA